MSMENIAGARKPAKRAASAQSVIPWSVLPAVESVVARRIGA